MVVIYNDFGGEWHCFVELGVFLCSQSLALTLAVSRRGYRDSLITVPSPPFLGERARVRGKIKTKHINILQAFPSSQSSPIKRGSVSFLPFATSPTGKGGRPAVRLGNYC